jgi:sulfhydrogenase subunit alpha
MPTRRPSAKKANVMSRTKTISVDYLARVEGEGALKVVVRDGVVHQAELNIFEPPRFFEALLRGRDFTEVPDITARICGICPVAYQMSTVHAMEDALGVTVDGPLRALRRLLYCGEWMESHSLHIYLLHAPDFLGYASGMDMAQDHGDAVRRGLELKRIGNEIMTVLGGREIHPINVRVGGFYRVPRKRELRDLAERLKWAREAACETLDWLVGFDYPDRERDYVFVALEGPGEYPFSEGRIVSNRGLDISARDYDDHFEESHLPRTNALRSCLRGSGAYLVGPLARYNLNFERLSPLAQEKAKDVGLGPACTNPYRSIMVRAVEVLYACDEALRLIDAYEEPDLPAVAIEPRAGVGYGATEAPRGLLYHRYRLEADGTVAEAQIVPPTSQNQASIEEDLSSFIGGFLDLPEDELRHRCEQTVRNYDPCISCATHFLKLDLDRG